MSLDRVYNDVISWAGDRNLIDGSNSRAQFIKLVEETGELAADLAKGRDVKDSVGDIMVVLTILARQEGYTLFECYQHAYQEIQHRKGKMVSGVFIKEE